MTFASRLATAWKALRSEPVPVPRKGEVSFADPRRLTSTGSIYTYNPSEVVGVKGLGIFDTMKRDDQVKAALAFKKHAVVATGWAVKAPKGKDETWEPREFCEQVLTALDGSVERAILEILSALTYGYSITEKVWDEYDGKIAIKALKTRRPHEMSFKIDGFGNLQGIQQNGRELSPMDKFIVYTHDMEFGNWYGTSDLEAAHRAWWLKRNGYTWMAMFLERLGIPPIFALYNAQAYPNDKLADLHTVLKNIQANTVGAIPRPEKDDLEMWVGDFQDGIDKVFLPALDRCDKDIAKALLMPGLLGMTSDDKEGSFARAQVHFDVFLLVIERIRNEISKYVINEHIIKPMVQLNYGLMEEYPCFEFNPLSDEVRVELLTAWGTLTGQKVVTPTVEDEHHVRQLLKFPELSPEGEAKRADQEKIDAETQQATLDNMKNPPEKQAKFEVYAQGTTEYFRQIEDALDDLEGRAEKSLTAALEEARDSLIALVRRDFDPKGTGMAWVRNLSLKKFGVFQAELVDLMRAAVELGVSMVGSEVKTFDSSVTATPRAAVRAMTEKAFWIAGVVKDKLTKDAQEVLIQAIKNGESLGETVNKLTALFLPYIGDPQTISDGTVLEPMRLRTIVRTNTTDAYNTGRLSKIRDPKMKPWIKAVRYSAILDERTTELCSGLHGSLFKPDDPSLDRLTPPNHFNCRSLLVPVMIDQKVDEADYATREQVGRALDLMQPGFGGSE